MDVGFQKEERENERCFHCVNCFWIIVTLWMNCFCFVWIVENLVLASYCPVKGENENYIAYLYFIFDSLTKSF